MPVQQTIMVARDDLTKTAIDQQSVRGLEDGEVLLAVEAFALTANNVTYAVVGDTVRYWDFYPAPDGWGVVPVWGHARVSESRCAGIAAGERVYGYLPMASHVVVRPGKLSPALFRDMTPHRQPMAPVYNQYKRLAADPAHDPAREQARMLFEPLFLTSFLIADQLRRADWHGADTLVVTSASSKTALGTAHVARAISPGVTRIAATSAGNVAFVETTGLYDRVVTYDALNALEPAGRTVIVDFAGDAAVLRALHARLDDRLALSLRVGVTHHEAERGDAGMPGPKPVWFFAPDAAEALIGAIGQDDFQRAVAERWADFVREAEGWVTIEAQLGADAIVATWRALVTNRARADIGHILSFAE